MSDVSSGAQCVCASCAHQLPITTAHIACPTCGGLLDIVHAAPGRDGAELRVQWDDVWRAHVGAATPEASGVWRYGDVVVPGMGAHITSAPEGNTPLLARDALSAWTEIAHLRVKHEGHNPTGSFKDRGMTVAVSQARRVGARGVVCASTGNTSSSLASYAALAGLQAVVVMPKDGVTEGKLAQAMAYGATTLLVRGDFDDCLRLVREASDTLGLYLVNSLNPFRLEGQKTIVFELLQQCAWDAPEWIVLPAGNLGNTAAFGKALRELYAWGVISRLPRLAAVQAAGAAPFAASFAEGFATRHTVVARTIATAIKIGNPASYDRAVRAIRDTNGVVVAVSDDEILDAKAMVDACGIGAEPASAASVAGAKLLRTRGLIAGNDRVVCVLTGHMLKDVAAMTSYHLGARRTEYRNPPTEIDATIASMAQALPI